MRIIHYICCWTFDIQKDKQLKKEKHTLLMDKINAAATSLYIDILLNRLPTNKTRNNYKIEIIKQLTFLITLQQIPCD